MTIAEAPVPPARRPPRWTDAVIAVHAHRLRRKIAAMTTAMNGLDVLAFAGGIGEHQPEVRAEVRAEAASGLAFLGVTLDPDRTAGAPADCDISAPGVPVTTLVITPGKTQRSPGSAGT